MSACFGTERLCRIVMFLFLALFICNTGGTVHAEEALSVGVESDTESELPGEDEIRSRLLEILPEEVRELFPDSAASADAAEFACSVDGVFVLKLLYRLLTDAGGWAARTVGSFLPLLLIGILAERIENVWSGRSQPIFRWVTTICVGLFLFRRIGEFCRLTLKTLGDQSAFMRALGALLSALYLMGGNSVTAGVHAEWLALFLTLLERIASALLIPMAEVVFSATIIACIAPSADLRPMVKTLQNTVTILMTLLMTVLSVVMTFQTSLAASADSVAMRAVKFAASGSVPLIGSLLGDSVKTLSTGLSALKGTVGSIGVLTLLIMTLIPLLTLFLTKFGLNILLSIAQMMGCKSFPILLEDAIRILNYEMAMLALFGTLFLYCISLFAMSVCAI